MTRGYEIYNGLHHDNQRYFVVSNYPHLNKVASRGFKNIPYISKFDLGVWKIKKLKV